MNETVAEKHPLGFFLPENTQLLMLGSFPPPQQRWSMNFYYPNIQNDMWRILGLLFYVDKDFFLEAPRKFSEEKCKAFCRKKGLGIGDTGVEVIRQKGMLRICSLKLSDRLIWNRYWVRFHNAGPLWLPDKRQWIRFCRSCRCMYRSKNRQSDLSLLLFGKEEI